MKPREDGMRVLNLVDQPAHCAVAPIATFETRAAAGGDEGEEDRGLTRY
jgi:hypothetical protein